MRLSRLAMPTLRATPGLRASQVAQLGDFDEQLYKVTGAGEDQYLIATSEQAAMHLDFSRTE